MLLVKRELWRGPLCRHLSLQLPETVAGMALQLEPALRGGGGWGGGEGSEREIGSNRGRTKGVNSHRFCAETQPWCFPEAVLPKPIGIFSSWFPLNPFIVLRVGWSPGGIHTNPSLQALA